MGSRAQIEENLRLRPRPEDGNGYCATVFLKQLKERNNSPLDLETIRTMNINGFDVIPDHNTMRQVADAYRREYNEEVFK